jgi:hypothetical protein
MNDEAFNNLYEINTVCLIKLRERIKHTILN